MNQHITASPLTWPHGWKRTKIKLSSQFRTKRSNGCGSDNITIAKAVSFVLAELHRMGTPDYKVIISTDLQLRQDGLPYSKQKIPDDVGASVWWKDGDNQRVIALDKYNRIADNIYAIGKTIEAMRGIERWGSGEILERTFTGFNALPDPDSAAQPHWRTVLSYEGNDIGEAETHYKKRRSEAHSDKGGSDAEFHLVQQAWEQAQAELR